jgi:hypothetical protein
MAPEGLPEVEPPPSLTAQVLVAGLRQGALQLKPDRPDEAFLTFAQLGREVARGRNRWD